MGMPPDRRASPSARGLGFSKLWGLPRNIWIASAPIARASPRGSSSGTWAPISIAADYHGDLTSP